MKARPILFSTPMVQALLGGSKTMTRRIVKPQPEHRENESVPNHYGTFFHGWNLDHSAVNPSDYWDYCPYGKPGDLLWVRESIVEDCSGSISFVGYKAGGQPCSIIPWTASKSYAPSIHMPKKASRLTLEITGVVCERLQDISEEDAQAEGIDVPHIGCSVPSEKFAELWESINGDDSWDKNPWVWVVKFKVHKVNVDGFE